MCIPKTIASPESTEPVTIEYLCSDEMAVSRYLTESPFKSMELQSLDEHTDGSIVLIDMIRMYNDNPTAIGEIIQRGIPIIMLNLLPDMVQTIHDCVGFITYNENSELTGMWLHDNLLGSYNVYDYDSKALALSGICELMMEETGLEAPEGASLAYFDKFTKICGDFGKFNVRTYYYQITDTRDQNDFYLTHYTIQGICNDGYSKSLLGVRSNLESTTTWPQELVDYGPTTAPGTTTVGFDAGVTAGYSSGPTVTPGFNVSWSHSYSDVDVIDDCDFDYNLFEIKYDINECTNSGYHTLKVEPGSVEATPDGFGYYADETYMAQFCHVVMHGFWHNNFTDFTQHQTVMI